MTLKQTKRLRTSRTFWGAAIGILSGILSWASVNTAGVDDLLTSMGASPEITATVLQVVAAIGGVVAIWGRKVATKAIGCVALCGLLTVGGFGCGALSPSERYGVASETYTLTVDAVTTLGGAGLLTDDDLIAFNEARLEMRDLLDAWEAAVNTDGFTEWSQFDRAGALLNALIQVKLKAERNEGNGSESNSGVGPHRRYFVSGRPSKEALCFGGFGGARLDGGGAYLFA